MKYLILLLMAITLHVTATAQTITDITASDTSWYWFYSHDPCSSLGCTHSETAEHFTGGETVIHGITYKDTYDSIQFRHIRMDAQHRVYQLDANDTVETLLYAWDAQPGDSITFHGFIGDSSLQSHTFIYKIDSVSSVNSTGQPQRQLYVSTNIPTGVAGNYMSLVWVEGIGEKDHGLHSVFVSDLYNGFNFCGVHKDSAYIYTKGPGCHTLTGIDDQPLADQLQIYPVPADDVFTIHTSAGVRLTGYDLIDLSGQSVSAGEVRTNDQNVGISYLPAGLYYLMLHDDNGNIAKKKVVKR